MSSYQSRRPVSTTSDSSNQSDSRKRQSKRDDAIRKRIENDLSKKKRQGVATSRRKKAEPGTVLSLKPSDPIICKTSFTAYEVSQLMSARRENCVLVINDSGELIGIFTAKDLAFRIVALGLNANQVTIDRIMTANPLCAQASSPASEALTLMVERGFRHLPVLSDDNQIVGVLDITKCYAQQMEKLERMHSSSKKLYEALDSVHTEIGMDQQPSHVYQYFEELKNRMNGPTLESVLDGNTIPVYVSEKAYVHEATVLMKENKTTAVLVKNSEGEVKGIFTSKDVVLRVIAAGLDPKKCTIIRVMTPHPDVAKVSLPIQKALRQIFDGNYLNLPVVDNDENIIGMVDVLKLTYATLNQIKQIESSDRNTTTLDGVGQSSNDLNEGPAWNKFWTSLDKQDDTDSFHSDSFVESAPDVTPSEFHAFNIDIQPSDSVSHVEANTNNSKQSRSKISSVLETPETVSFVYKFQSPAMEGRVHRISLNPGEGILKLRELMDAKLHANDFAYLKVGKSFDESGNLSSDDIYAISYVDDEGDIVSITSDHDLLECTKIYRKLNYEKADLYIHNPHEPAPIEAIKKSKNHTLNNNSFIPGISNDLLIPTIVGVLASSAIIGYLFSRK